MLSDISVQPEAILAAVVAAVALLAYYYAPGWVFGADARFWNPIRRLLVPVVDQLLDEHGGDLDYASYELDNSEHAARVEADVVAVGDALADAGYKRMPLAALKTLPDGRVEAASWARRPSLLARRQTHVIVFEADNGVDIYAHGEPNAINPLTAWKHYRGRGYDPAAGVKTVREWLNNSDLSRWSRADPTTTG